MDRVLPKVFGHVLGRASGIHPGTCPFPSDSRSNGPRLAAIQLSNHDARTLAKTSVRAAGEDVRMTYGFRSGRTAPWEKTVRTIESGPGPVAMGGRRSPCLVGLSK